MLLPISGWDLDVHPRLHGWLAERLEEDYPALKAAELGPGAAEALVHGGYILPVLDGLDEIGAQTRARVIAALNASLSGDDQLIVTSRTAEFAAAVIAPDLLTPQAAAAYLRACLPAALPEAWRNVLAALDDHTLPGLSELAATPLGLWLIRTVYADSGADPSPLTGALGGDAAALRAHLFDRLIPAVIAARTPSADPGDHFRPRHRLDPDATRRYLTSLAPIAPPAETRDIAWWRIAASAPLTRRSLRFTAGILAGFGAGLPVGLLFGLAAALAAGVVIALAIGFAAGSWAGEVPGYADLRMCGRARVLRHALTRNVSVALLTGLPAGLGLGLPAGPLAGVAVGLVIGGAGACRAGYRGRLRLLWKALTPSMMAGLGAGLVAWLAVATARELHAGRIGEPAFGLGALLLVGLGAGLVDWAELPTLTSISTPASTWRSDRALTLLRVGALGLAFGLAFGLARGLGLGFEAGLRDGLSAGLVAGAEAGFVFGIPVGLVAGRHHAWLACVVVTGRLALARRLPWRLMGFLDDAHRLGLLRAVGPIYQFRHADLHDHLAAAAHTFRTSRGRADVLA